MRKLIGFDNKASGQFLATVDFINKEEGSKILIPEYKEGFSLIYFKGSKDDERRLFNRLYEVLDLFHLNGNMKEAKQ